MQTFMSKMSPNSNDPNATDGAQVDSGPGWMMRRIGNGAGIISGVIAIIFGVWCMLSFSPLCLIAGIWQILAGFIVIAVEAPFCCVCLDCVTKISKQMDGRPVWQKALFYLIISIVGPLLCRSFSAYITFAAFFITFVVYGLQMLGPKAAREEMMGNAETLPTTNPTVNNGFSSNSSAPTPFP